MKLLGTYRSPYVRKVRVVAAEAGLLDSIVLEEHSVHLASYSREVMALNPLNKVPTLIADDGTALFDSLVICAFLAQAAARDDLLPTAVPARLRVLNTHALGQGLLDLLIMRLVERAKPAERAWPDVMEATAAKISAVLHHLDAANANLTEEGCTVGTMTVAVALGYLDFRFGELDWRSGHDGLARWYQAISLRASLRDNPFLDETPARAGKVR